MMSLARDALITILFCAKTCMLNNAAIKNGVNNLRIMFVYLSVLNGDAGKPALLNKLGLTGLSAQA